MSDAVDLPNLATFPRVLRGRTSVIARLIVQHGHRRSLQSAKRGRSRVQSANLDYFSLLSYSPCDTQMAQCMWPVFKVQTFKANCVGMREATTQ